MGRLWAVPVARLLPGPLGKQKGDPQLDKPLPNVTQDPHIQGDGKGLPEEQASNICPFNPQFRW